MISLLMSLSCFEKLIEESDKSYVVAMENNKKGNIGSATPLRRINMCWRHGKKRSITYMVQSFRE